MPGQYQAGRHCKKMSLPYWRLSGFYFFYFAFVGAISPYFGLYLKSLEFSAFQIGILMSLLQVMRMFAPNIWGWAADHTGKRVAIVQAAAILSLVSYIGVFFGTSFLWLFVVMSLLSFFWSASLPLVEATTLSHLGERTEKYGRIRLWGSVGFIFAVVALGYILDFVPIRFLLWAILGMMIGLALFARHIPEAQVTPHHTDHMPAWNVIKQPVVLAFFAASFFNAAAHGPYYIFYSIYLVDHGYSKSSVGWLWALGVICEILVFSVDAAPDAPFQPAPDTADQFCPGCAAVSAHRMGNWLVRGGAFRSDSARCHVRLRPGSDH